MKFLPIIFSLFLLTLPLHAIAQSDELTSTQSQEQPLTFSYQAAPVDLVQFDTATLLQRKSSTALKSVGFLLQGLKYRSAVDEFNAHPPFDIRKFESPNVSSYQSSIQNTYLLRSQPFAVKF